MFQERCYDREGDVNNNFFADNMSNNIDMDINMNNNMDMNYQGNSCPSPLVEPMQERLVHRTIMHEVPQDCLVLQY